jgi:alpha-tubulin suppressor-like RCC1 family protein
MIIEQSVHGFGDNTEGQLGEEIEPNEHAIVPIMIQHKQPIVEVACGWNHTLIRDGEGSVFSAGRSDHG